MTTLKRFAFPLALLAAFVVVVSSCARKAPTPEVFSEGTTLAAALAESKSSGKPVFVVVTADWCAPCQAYKRNALSDSDAVRVLSTDTIPVYLNADHDIEALRLLSSAGLQVRALPTTALITEGKVARSFEGGISADALRAWIAQGG